MDNIFVGDCRFNDTDTGLRLKSGRDRGGLIHNVWVKNVVMCDIAEEAVLVDSYYQEKVGDASQVAPVDVTADTPRFEGINIEGIICTDAERAIVIKGLPEMNVRDIKITNSSFDTRSGCTISHASDVTFSDVTFKVENGDILKQSHSKNIIIKP